MTQNEKQEALEHLLAPKKPSLPSFKGKKKKEKESEDKDEETKEEKFEPMFSESSQKAVDIPAPVLKPSEIESKSLDDLTRDAREEKAAAARERTTDERGRKIQQEEPIKYGPTLYNAEEKRVDQIAQLDDMRRTQTFIDKSDPFRTTPRQIAEMPNSPNAEGDIEKYVTDRAIDMADVWKEESLIKGPETLKKYRRR